MEEEILTSFANANKTVAVGIMFHEIDDKAVNYTLIFNKTLTNARDAGKYVNVINSAILASQGNTDVAINFRGDINYPVIFFSLSFFFQ